jgi:hypothetical protein
MTLWSRANAGLVRLWRTLALRIRNVLSRVTEGRRNQIGQAYLLHPRCCRTEQHQEYQ